MSFDASAAREPLFSEKETAELLHISASYLRLLRAKKKIRCYKFGGDKWGRILYSERHINEFKRQAEQTPVAA